MRIRAPHRRWGFTDTRSQGVCQPTASTKPASIRPHRRLGARVYTDMLFHKPHIVAHTALNWNSQAQPRLSISSPTPGSVQNPVLHRRLLQTQELDQHNSRGATALFCVEELTTGGRIANQALCSCKPGVACQCPALSTASTSTFHCAARRSAPRKPATNMTLVNASAMAQLGAATVTPASSVGE